MCFFYYTKRLFKRILQISFLILGQTIHFKDDFSAGERGVLVKVFLDETGDILLEKLRQLRADGFRRRGVQTDDVEFTVAHDAQVAEDLVHAGVQFPTGHRMMDGSG